MRPPNSRMMAPSPDLMGQYPFQNSIPSSAGQGAFLTLPVFLITVKAKRQLRGTITPSKGNIMILERAKRMITAAETKAREIGQPMNIAVVDEGGNLVAFARMDGAWLGSIDIAINKAFTSRAFDIATRIFQSSANRVKISSVSMFRITAES